MEKYKSKVIEDKAVWERFLLSKDPKSFLQSWNWGEVNERMGAKIFRLGFFQGKKLVGICLLIREDAKRGPHLIVPGGPVLDFGNKKLLRFFVDEIGSLAYTEGVWFVRIRPEILESRDNRELLKSFGFVSAPMHLHAENTWILDISQDEEKILMGMRKSTRYLVKKGLGSGLSVELSEDPRRAKILFDLQVETAKRHKFVGFPQKLFEAEIETFAKDNRVRVFECKLNRKVLAAAIIIFYGNAAYYHFSASTSKYPSLPFSYYLQWKIIQEAKRRSLKYYNLWGVAPNNNPNHRFAGVTLFKTGFGGQRVDWLHASDLPTSPLYWLTYLFERIRKFLRRL